MKSARRVVVSIAASAVMLTGSGVGLYGGVAGASFAAGDVSDTDCDRRVDEVTIAHNIERWQCQVAAALGDQASADVTYANREVTVTVRWAERLELGPASSSVTVETVL